MRRGLLLGSKFPDILLRMLGFLDKKAGVSYDLSAGKLGSRLFSPVCPTRPGLLLGHPLKNARVSR